MYEPNLAIALAVQAAAAGALAYSCIRNWSQGGSGSSDEVVADVIPPADAESSMRRS